MSDKKSKEAPSRWPGLIVGVVVAGLITLRLAGARLPRLVPAQQCIVLLLTVGVLAGYASLKLESHVARMPKSLSSVLHDDLLASFRQLEDEFR